jgi:hypothetical protein
VSERLCSNGDQSRAVICDNARNVLLVSMLFIQTPHRPLCPRFIAKPLSNSWAYREINFPQLERYNAGQEAAASRNRCDYALHVKALPTAQRSVKGGTGKFTSEYFAV